MTATAQGKDTARLSSLDTLRAALVAWIIWGHALLGYSAVGGWAYDEVNEVTLAPSSELVLAALLGPSALFLMGTFFLVAGLFTPVSLAHKGPRRFALDRTVRLGVPFMVSALALWPLFLWLAYRSAGQSVSYGWLLTGRDRVLDSGALWFAEVLLIFSLAYLVWRVLRGERPGSTPEAPLTGTQLTALAAGIAVTSFVVRLWIPARGTQIGDLHLWQWPQLAAMFGLGIVGARRGLAERVPERLWRSCGKVTLVTVIAIPVVALAMGVTNLAQDISPFLGGWRWAAVLTASVEALLVVFGSVWLLGFAQRTFSGTSRFTTAAIRGSFAAFVLQGPVLLTLAIAARSLPVPAEAKAVLVGVLGVLVCFALGWVAVTRTRLGRFM
ncbi:MAG: acyltransferase family protein [Haloechinothrix sp.]